MAVNDHPDQTAADTDGSGGCPEKPPPTDPLQKAIDDIRKKADEAKMAKVTADGASAALDGQLTALLSLQKESDKAKQAYEAAHEQLEIDQQAFQDYDESAKDDLVKQLTDEGIEAVNALIDAKQAADKARASAVNTATTNLQTDKDAAEVAEQNRKAKTAALTQYKQLASTIGARHATLKALRDEVTKARQANQPGLAYWLLTNSKGFGEQLRDVKGWLIEPSELPNRLLDAINQLAAAETAKAAADGSVAKRQAELAEAERMNADQEKNGEKNLRDKLSKVTAAAAAAESTTL